MQTDVLIVGAGPTGLSLAVQLIRYGVDFIIVDTKESTTPHSKAIGVQARTLEIYEQIGLADKLIAAGAPAESARMFAGGRERGRIDFGELGKGMSRYPYVLFVEQGLHEVILHEFIKSQNRSVRWRTEFQSFEQTSEGLRARVK
jgi:2-polyprenyl-6-methoxyphenol hydroxylase-like FAD-dependent oxidoreductase